eukprot:GHVR01075057.1.p1 GENE.GHVR01075057.1~~GHVR01075057.1.p1  ORF type:complete len:100 (-),score=2.29 GHVR01075057.1:122-421(-)
MHFLDFLDVILILHGRFMTLYILLLYINIVHGFTFDTGRDENYQQLWRGVSVTRQMVFGVRTCGEALVVLTSILRVSEVLSYTLVFFVASSLIIHQYHW